MKRLFVCFLLVCLAPSAFCQIGVSMALNHGSYLLYENILAKIMIKNNSGKALIFGENANGQGKGKLEFVLETPNGSPADRKKNNYDPMVNFVIPPGLSHSIIVPVNRMYIADKAGAYRIRAVMHHDQLEHAYESGTTTFFIFNGMTVWERSIGVPKLYHKEDEKTEPLPRKAKILSFFDQENKYFALMIEDKDKVFGLERLGHDIGNQSPRVETDVLNKIHILLQISPKVYVYFVFDVNCVIQEKGVYVKTDVSPTFVTDPTDGAIMVVGGRKAIKDVDYVEENGVPVMKEVE
jgi:hypothetical protein